VSNREPNVSHCLISEQCVQNSMTNHCCDCDRFENRCYQNGTVISVCNERHEVVDPEDNCEIREKKYKQWLRRCGR